MHTYIVMAATAAPALAVGYFIGRARGIEEAGRRWLAVMKRTELAWTITYRSLHQTHAALAEALLAGLMRAKETIVDLRERLEATLTATPTERN